MKCTWPFPRCSKEAIWTKKGCKSIRVCDEHLMTILKMNPSAREVYSKIKKD